MNKVVHLFSLSEVMPLPRELSALQNYLPLARHVISHGRGPGSLEDEATAGLDYRVITGEVIQSQMPWLWDVYADQNLRHQVARLVGESVRLDDNLPSAVNVNVVEGVGARYELHTDSRPYTLILFVTDLPPGCGGELDVYLTSNHISIHPQFGLCALFDGSSLPHAVRPLAGGPLAEQRLSIPMVFLSERGAFRDARLDEHLYGSQS